MRTLDPGSDPQAASLRSMPTLEDAYRAHSADVFRLALRLLGTRSDAEDVVQEVFIEAHRGMHALREVAALRGWLSTVTIRLVRRRLRVRKIQLWFGIGGDFAAAIPDEGSTPEQMSVLRSLYASLARLPVDQQLAWSLRHIEGERLDAVALACGCSLATAKRRIAAAEDFLDKEIRHER